MRRWKEMKRWRKVLVVIGAVLGALMLIGAVTSPSTPTPKPKPAARVAKAVPVRPAKPVWQPEAHGWYTDSEFWKWEQSVDLGKIGQNQALTHDWLDVTQCPGVGEKRRFESHTYFRHFMCFNGDSFEDDGVRINFEIDRKGIARIESYTHANGEVAP